MKLNKLFILGVLVGGLLTVLAGSLLFSTTSTAWAQPPGPAPVNADKVDGFDAFASTNPVANALLALNNNAQFPVSVITQGSGSGLDADFIDGLNSSDFALANHNHDDNYVNEGQTASITTDMLVDESITSPKIANDAINGSKIANITRIITANLMGVNSESGLTPLGNGFGVRTTSSGISDVFFTFAVPYDYSSGDLTVRELYFVHDAAGTAHLNRTIQQLTPTGDVSEIVSSFPASFTHDASVPGFKANRTWILSESLVQPGNLYWVWYRRSGDQPGDTMGRLDLRAVAIEYQAEQ